MARTVRAAISTAIPTIALLATGLANAATISVADRTTWEASVGTFDTEDFESTPTQTEICTGPLIDDACSEEFVFSTDKLDIIVPVGSDGMHEIRDAVGPGTVNGSREFHSDLHGQILVAGVTFNTIAFPVATTAFAVDLANVFDNCDAIQCGPIAQPMSVTIAGDVFLIDSGATFFGAISDTPFTSLTIQITDPSLGGVVLPTLDNLSFAVIPEPTQGVLMLIGLTIMARQRPRA